MSARLERSVAALLRPEQATRLRALAPAAVGDLLARICRLSRAQPSRSTAAPRPRKRSTSRA